MKSKQKVLSMIDSYKNTKNLLVPNEFSHGCNKWKKHLIAQEK